MSSAGFELAIPAIKLLQNYALDRTVTGIDHNMNITANFLFSWLSPEQEHLL
jgi:malate synthase